MPRPPGTRIGAYEIVAPLGAGGMGEVYRARDTRLGREVALKLVREDLARDPERMLRLEREARAVASLSHPNIVTLFSLEEADGARFLVMELVEGRSLDAVIGAHGMPVPAAVELLIALADALATAHERSIVHRDLKPANLMVTREERLKVLDFGLARIEVPASDPQGTQAATVQAPLSGVGQVLGTAPYMAPEQVRGEAADARTDLFACGIVFYEMLTGVRPFRGETSADVASAILRDTPAPLREARPGLPDELDAIVTRCLQKDRLRRFESAQELRQALVRVRQALSGATSSMRAAESETPSIAVLPFANRSADAEDEYFAEGLADELLNMLAKIRGLRVAARTSSSAFKGKAVPIAEIGRALGVASVLEGSLRKSGKRVRISVQLVKVADGYHLWSETYDRTLDDIFAVQDDIAQAVVKELRTTLLGEAADSNASGDAKAEVVRAAKGRGKNAEAHRLYLQARHILDRRGPQAVAQAGDMLRRAVKLEPSNALVWAAIATMEWIQAAYLAEGDVAEGAAKTRAAALRALELEPDLPEGHLALAELQLSHDWDWAAARKSFMRALELAPGSTAAREGLATLEADAGSVERAVELAHQVVELDPLSASGQASLASILRTAGRLEESVEACRNALALAPERTASRLQGVAALVLLGRGAEALEMSEAEPAEWARVTGMVIALHVLGREEEARAALATLKRDFADTALVQIAASHCQLGDADEAFQWLDKGFAQRDPGMAFLLREQLFAPIKGDPRWTDLMRRMNLA